MDGQIVGDVPLKPRAPVAVYMWDDHSSEDNGVQAEVLSAREIPGSFPGVLEVRARVPEEAPPGGAITLAIQIGSGFVERGVTLALR